MNAGEFDVEKFVEQCASAIVSKREAEELAQKEAEERREAERLELWRTFNAQAVLAAPEWLRQYALPREDESGIPGQHEVIDFEIPGCVLVRIRIVRDRATAEGWGAWEVMPVGRRSDEYPYMVRKYVGKEPGYDWHTEKTRRFYEIDAVDWESYSTLDEAIGRAHLHKEQVIEWTVKAEAKNERIREEILLEEAKQVQREAAMEQHAQVTAQKEEDERAALLKTFEDDAVALALLKVFTAVQEDRSHWQESIGALEDSIGRVDERYERSLSTLREENERAVRQAQSEVESARYDVSDLESKVRKLEKAR